jgi:uncharacterized membrane protein YvbJ
MKGSFFCEACGAEVKGRSDSCPSCGRSFLGVRCPRCDNEGSAEEFKAGCPKCGYLTEQKTAGSEQHHPEVPWPRKTASKRRPDWPASRYWTLSILIVISVGLIFYFWLR